jgi:UDP-N-acetyl-2-amino-2-deoxyglucuronate dehydrogenase
MFGVGFVAPRHMAAIKSVGGELIAICEPKHDVVGVIDSYFPEAEFFSDERKFKTYCKKISVDYVVICSPNYLHVPQSIWGMEIGANVICEKPIALDSYDLLQLAEAEARTGKKINTILQLRLKSSLIALKQEVKKEEYYKVSVDYITPRGCWYHKSWKGSEGKSGGLATNIGIHLFDLCLWLFGKEQGIELYKKTDSCVIGKLFLEGAEVHFNLSIGGKEPKRNLIIGDKQIEFSQGFTQLHEFSYQYILNGKGFGLIEASPSVLLCEKIRNMKAG